VGAILSKMKKQITQAFRELRKKGYFARQNYWCCQSCAWASLPSETTKAVFYHEQDNYDLKKKNSCYLSWIGNGREITDTLNKYGILTEWNGKEDTRIRIY
jgi:hypothetical protein